MFEAGDRKPTSASSVNPLTSTFQSRLTAMLRAFACRIAPAELSASFPLEGMGVREWLLPEGFR